MLFTSDNFSCASQQSVDCLDSGCAISVA